jgi:hypothetical protein
MSTCTVIAFSTLLWSVNSNYFIFNVIGQLVYWFMGKIRMRFAAGGAPVAVKHRAVNRSTKVRISLCVCVRACVRACVLYYTRIIHTHIFADKPSALFCFIYHSGTIFQLFTEFLQCWTCQSQDLILPGILKSFSKRHCKAYSKCSSNPGIW